MSKLSGKDLAGGSGFQLLSVSNLLASFCPAKLAEEFEFSNQSIFFLRIAVSADSRVRQILFK
ncbi:hypothetical protein [Acetobacterium wieringae]|uniref:hypothetical protein n=1 Tax=Acetobacterium wieringae TaxID=52694 RepID=UPI001A9C1328|nr:hypothetical protein [Acetobacterium wieringae]